MITDKQRREVARKLRKLASENQGAIGSMCKMQEVLTQAKKITGTMNLPSVAHVLERYADLIDRPTCRKLIPDEMEGLVFCSNCGAEIGEYSVPNYCHNCGAEVMK